MAMNTKREEKRGGGGVMGSVAFIRSQLQIIHVT